MLKMTLNELCQKIELQPEILTTVMDFSNEFDFQTVEKQLSELTEYDTAAAAYKTVTELLGDDPSGLKVLTCYLKAALMTHVKYAEKGIDDEIYFDTMKCFTRFVGECFERRDIWGFVDANWAYRHLNTSLVRIGALEFERTVRNGEPAVSVHIPSNADLSKESLDASFSAARRFLKNYYPDYAEAPIFCESWLMYPGLHDLLNPDSKILHFQSRFEIKQVNPISKNALTYIFHRADCSDYSSLPESSSLQRKAKALLLSGGNIGSAYGVLKEI